MQTVNSFTLHGYTFSRTTRRTPYTHAVVGYRYSRRVWHQAREDGSPAYEEVRPCWPYVAQISYASSLALARRVRLSSCDWTIIVPVDTRNVGDDE